jgi:hypothetical protein
MIGLSLCLLLSTCVLLTIGGATDTLSSVWQEGPVSLLLAILVMLVFVLVTAALLFIPYGFFVLGWMRIGDSRRELSALPTDNTVGDPVEGERKLTQWLSAMQSTEAYIGMIPRSAPYVPPENRPPLDFKPPRARITAQGWRVFGSILTAGFIAGALVGWSHGIDTAQGTEISRAFQPVGVVRLLAAGLLGSLAAMPVAIFVLAFYAEVREQDDAGADRPEPA